MNEGVYGVRARAPEDGLRPRSRPAPGCSLSWTIPARPGPARTLYGVPRPAIGLYASWRPTRL